MTRKDRNRLNAIEAEKNRKHPEPMTLMKRRFESGEVPSEADAKISMSRCGRQFCKPEVTPGAAEKAAQAMAEWDNSDPFAYGRTLLHVKQGFVSANTFVEEMQKRTIARRAARIREIENGRA